MTAGGSSPVAVCGPLAAEASLVAERGSGAQGHWYSQHVGSEHRLSTCAQP